MRKNFKIEKLSDDTYMGMADYPPYFCTVAKTKKEVKRLYKNSIKLYNRTMKKHRKEQSKQGID